MKNSIKILNLSKKAIALSSKCLLATIFFAFYFNLATGQKVRVAQKTPKKPSTKEFVISYAIAVNGANKKALQQTYNGGLKTVFVKNDLVRIRLVSLMRMQSIYFNNKNWVKNNIASVVKESGKYKSILSLTAKQWQEFNKRNDSVRCDIFATDTLTILNKLCTKAVLTFRDSTKLTVYYLPNAKSNIMAAAEPIFNSVPGLVMKYIYEIKKKSVTYTAVDFRIEPISNTVFLTPKIGYEKLKYNPVASNADVSEDADDDIEGSGDEDDNVTPAKAPAVAPPKGGGGK